MQPIYNTLSFAELTNDLLYAILALRSRIFVVEQNIVYLDPDGYDQQSLHVCMMDGERLIGCARIIPPGVKFPQPAVGRLVVDPAYRNRGLGAALMRRAVIETWSVHGKQPILIEAQAQLQKFYESLGYIALTEPYMLEGLLHVKMQISPQA